MFYLLQSSTFRLIDELQPVNRRRKSFKDTENKFLMRNVGPFKNPGFTSESVNGVKI